MFKPHISVCICHGLKRLIVVKAGYCKIGNDENKRINNPRTGRKNTQKSFRQTKNTTKSGRRKEILAKPTPRKNDMGKRVHDASKSSVGPYRFTRTKRKPTGELALFKKLYEQRGPNSQIAPYKYIAFDVRCFSHILSKGAYGKFRLYEKNIVLKTPEEHHLWETQRHKLKALPEWEWIFKLEQELKQEYYQKTKI